MCARRRYHSIVILLAGALLSGPLLADEGKVRPACFAGSWYPGTAAALSQDLDNYLAKAGPHEFSGKPIAVICPHAGYQYSAPTAAAAYASLRGQTYRRVIGLAFSHRHAGRYQGIHIAPDLTAYATPLGQVPIDRRACEELLKKPPFGTHAGVEMQEHSLELQLPFLQHVLGEFTLVPLYIGQMSDLDYARAAEALLPLIDDETLLVASTDFTHFGPNYGYRPFREDVPDKLRELALRAADPIRRCDYDGFEAHLSETQDTICGRCPVKLLLRILSMRGGAKGVLAAFDTSGRISGDWTNSVTYQSFVFLPRPGTLGDIEQAELLRIARETVTAHLNHQPAPTVDAGKLPAKLRENGACFVTIENRGELRGCIGNMVANGPLYEAVVRNAVSACEDHRFRTNPVTADELKQIRIEISYLTPMERVSDTDEIVVGQHGLMIGLGGHRGVLLPQVAYERGWTRTEFLEQTCRKAGLPTSAWKRPGAEIYSFEAEVFGEPE